jgi:stage V sporulation protein B
MNVVYPGSNANGPALLSTLGIASFFVCMTLMTNAVLQANGYERFTVYTLPIGGAIKIALNWVLVGTPSINVLGAPYGTLACYGAITLINLVFIKIKLTDPPKLTKIFVKPAICAGVMGVAAYSIYSLSKKLLVTRIASSWTVEAAAMILAVIVAVVVYLVLIIALKAVTRDDLKLLPKGEKLADKLKIQ